MKAINLATKGLINCRLCGHTFMKGCECKWGHLGCKEGGNVGILIYKK